ncbi:MAG TPA: FG-GAP-like repeat-containing protein [Methylomirabilota bacterium]|nr:FG-GAP-like repeat-containing protein [Methylomirabilota bacterium]
MSTTPSRPPVEDQEELVHSDDTIIGRALRRSVLALVVLTVTAGAAYLALRPAPKPKEQKVTPIAAPVSAQRPAVEIPSVRFTDVTKAAGIDFVHFSGARGEKLLPETMGSGVAFLDFDGDDDQDLLFVSGTRWPWDDRPVPERHSSLRLYRNDGQGRFDDVTTGSGLDVHLYGMGVAVGDYDNDGRPDVFISTVEEDRLFHNEGGGKFADRTREAGLAGATNAWGTACAWIDFDNDGDLDLFVANYVRWSREIDFEVGYKLVGIGRAYGQPMNFEGTFPYLYRNDGGTFTDVSADSGVQIKNPHTGVPVAKALGVAPVDLDGDGWIDLVIANDTVQNFVFHNQRNGRFKEIGAESGIAFDVNGNTRGAMGIDAARYRNDEALGIAIANFANEMTALYVSQQTPLLFVDEAIPEGIGPASRLLLKFGLFFFDYDLDGRLDVLTANGHLEEEISKIQQSQTYAQPAQLFWNCGPDGGACFVSVPSEKAGADLFRPIVGRGSAFADIDGDGDLDVVLTQTGGPPLLLRNDQQLGHAWIRLRLEGRKANRSAIGAWVRIKRGRETLSRQVMPTRSYLSQSELPVTIGLGPAGAVDEVEILWPGGAVQKVAGVKVGTLTRIEQAP